mgnify:FL=1
MKISVYITSYNKIQYIEQSINSVLSQTLKPFEIVIIDDASQDGSQDLIKSFASKYSNLIFPIFNEFNIGIAKCRNKALCALNGDLVTFLDGDDYFYPNKLELEYKQLIKCQNTQVVYSNFNYVDKTGELIDCFAEETDVPATGDIFINTFTRNYNVKSGSNYIYEMFYKNCAFEIGLYDTNIKIWEDWDFRIRMSKIFRYGYCSKINSVYRQLPDSLHTSHFETHYHEQIKIYNKNKPLIQDLQEEEKSLIHNRVYSKIKSLFQHIMEKNRQDKLLFRLLFYAVHFILIFKTRKSISTALTTLVNK